MTRKELRKALDARLLDLIESYYNNIRSFEHYAEEQMYRAFEIIRMAWDLEVIDGNDFSTIIGIVCFIGTMVTMEDRLS